MDLQSLTNQELLERISRHCPSAMATFLHCMNRQNDKGQVYFDKKMVEEEMSISWTKFRNQVKMLALENILEWHFSGYGIMITLADLNEDE